jgi:NAD(P)-dependent dehydrogenase (short-subunit alcohol dehydrogenase family)
MIADRHDPKIHLLFNNAGIGGGGMTAHSHGGMAENVQRLLRRRLSLHTRRSAKRAEGHIVNTNSSPAAGLQGRS